MSVLAASAIALGALLVQALPHAAPARDVAADGFTSPLEEVPQGWPVVDIGDPAEGTCHSRMPTTSSDANT
jgi:hypothetical protein